MIALKKTLPYGKKYVVDHSGFRDRLINDHHEWDKHDYAPLLFSGYRYVARTGFEDISSNSLFVS